MSWCIKCDRCDLNLPVSLGEPCNLSPRYYDLGQGKIAPIECQHAWCLDCEAIKEIESLPTPEKVIELITKFTNIVDGVDESENDATAYYLQLIKESKNISDEADKSENTKTPFPFYTNFLRNIVSSRDEWIAWSRSRQVPLCLTCGSKSVLSCRAHFCWIDGTVMALDFNHPGCGGNLTLLALKWSGPRISWGPAHIAKMNPRYNDKWKTFVVYSPDGLLSDPLEKLTTDYPPLMNTFKLVVANELGIDGFEPRRPVPGEDEFPILFRHVRDIIRKEKPGKGQPTLPHQLKADFPKLYTGMCQYIRQQVTTASHGLTATTLATTEPPPSTMPLSETVQRVSCLTPFLKPLADKQLDENLNVSFFHNPFWILGATLRDDRRRIVELAEEKALHFDHEACQKARLDLTNPRTRLAVEIAWLPGVSPKKAEQMAHTLQVTPHIIRDETGLPSLAHANLIASAFEGIDEYVHPQIIAKSIRDFATIAEALDPEEILRDLNEDRSVSSFPEIKSLQLIEDELTERRRYYLKVIRNLLNKMPAEHIIETMTLTVNVATRAGEEHAPALIDALMDSYEVETQSFLQREAENVDKLIEAVALTAPRGEQAVKPIVDKLEQVARNWDRVAQPIQVSMKTRGSIHRPSYDMACKIRSLGVDLNNKHQLLGLAERIVILVSDIFSEVQEMVETLEKDTEAIKDIRLNQTILEQSHKEWASSITYEAEIGLILKNMLRISPAGLEWKGQHYSLESVTRVRWGGISHSVNGISTGTAYTIAFGDNRTEAVVSLRHEAVYSALTDRLWKAVCVRLINDTLVSLRDGKSIQFGDAVVEDSAVSLTRHKFFSANERVRLAWSKTHVWSAEGNFVIGSRDDKKTYATSSYIETPNTHVLEAIIRLAFKKEPVRLSNLLKDD